MYFVGIWKCCYLLFLFLRDFRLFRGLWVLFLIFGSIRVWFIGGGFCYGRWDFMVYIFRVVLDTVFALYFFLFFLGLDYRIRRLCRLLLRGRVRFFVEFLYERY